MQKLKSKIIKKSIKESNVLRRDPKIVKSKSVTKRVATQTANKTLRGIRK